MARDPAREIAAVVRIAGLREPADRLDELEASPAMRRAGGIILAEFQGQLESEDLAERVYWAMRTAFLQRGRTS